MNRLLLLTAVLAAGSMQPLAAEDLSARVRRLTASRRCLGSSRFVATFTPIRN